MPDLKPGYNLIRNVMARRRVRSVGAQFGAKRASEWERVRE